MSARPSPVRDVPGLAVRRIAADILDGVIRRGRPLDDQLDGHNAHRDLAALTERDRALVRALIATTLRRLGSLRHLLGRLLDKGCPAGAPRVETCLLIGAAQILWLDIPDHAAVDLAVRLAREDRNALHFSGLINAVLRRVAREGAAILGAADAVALDTPAWLRARWNRAYGDTTARAIAAANGHEAALDLTVGADAPAWSRTLGARLLPTGTLRMVAHGPVSALPGFAEGAWWVQDAAAAMPVRLLGDIRGSRVADLCAAPGGKTAQLAQAGAQATAIDRSAARIARLRDNLARLGLSAETVTADATGWEGGEFDAVLLDAPCSATGTIRRHPDIPWLKREADLAGLAAHQARLLDRAAALVRPGGQLLYCVCSLEPEEGEQAVAALLARNAELRREPFGPGEIPGLSADFLTPQGELRTLPCHWPDPDPRFAGLDGFYAARLRRA